jgi:hypothetical protein
MRFANAVLVLGVALLPAACASAQPGPRTYLPPAPAAFRLVEVPAVPPPANDIPESERRAWIEANRPQAYYVPSQEQPADESCSSGYGCGGWGIGLPISLGFGWSSGCGGGFGVGVNVLGLGVGIGFGGSCW